MTLLAWLADAAPHLENAAQLLVALDHPVIPAAVDWIEAALSISETQIELPAQPAAGSPWAAWAG
jgi:hypothetical protein